MSAGTLWGVDPGADFPAVFVAGLLERFGAGPPEALARVRIYLNSGRMLRRVRAELSSGPARLLPRLALVSDLGRDVALGPMPPARSPLRRKLELARLVEALIAAEPDLAPRAAAHDLAGSLIALLEEMQGEGVGFDALARLDVSDLSGHWARSQRFLGLLADYLAETGAPPDAAGRQRIAAQTLARRWAEAPPEAPVIVAGSTGSRGATRLLMEAVLALPRGHVVLPGFDFAMPDAAWQALHRPEPQQDHPQYRYAVLSGAPAGAPPPMARWHGTTAPDPARNRLVSLALRPAPVTDRWQAEGPELGDLAAATAGMTLIEAPDPRAEATALALILREAAETGRRAALVTPDRMLTRRVTALLDRWDIEPDDSAGRPLGQMAVGRLLRQIAGLWAAPVDPAGLVALLKHPLVHAAAGRGDHLRHSRDYELWQRGFGPAFPLGDTLRRWAADRRGEAADWADWIAAILDDAAALAAEADLTTRVAALGDLHRRLVSGAAADPLAPQTEAALWPGPDGREAGARLAALEREAEAGGRLSGAAFARLLDDVLAAEIRDPDRPHPGVMIWGTLEARVQGADLVVLGGLADGVWPPAPAPDPWLNRRMRAEAGLLSPERQVGLSAHDFQQAAGAPEIVLSHALRDAEAPTVPSRWLNRLTCLLQGLPAQGGAQALAAMRARGQAWLDLAARLDDPGSHALHLPRAPRPAPRPPAGTKPDRISVTEVERLLRDPYALYATRILGLRGLNPLRRMPDAALRGTVLHAVLERAGPDLAHLDVSGLIALSRPVLGRLVAWPHIRALWQARLARAAPWFLAGEADRLADAVPAHFETKGEIALAGTGVTLTAKADRIDRRGDGALAVYDYKTGDPPSAKEQQFFNKQLLLVAAIAEAGGFPEVPPAPVVRAEYLGLGATPRALPAPLDDAPAAETLARLATLLSAHIEGSRPYIARRAPKTDAEAGDFDHLARRGEWDVSDPAEVIPVGGATGDG